MIDNENIKAILFDSGRTLNVPSTGHWFITPRFYEIVNAERITDNKIVFEKAMDKAYEHISKILTVNTEGEEYLMFREFYSILLSEVKYPDISTDIIDALARDNVFNDEKFLFFDDVEPVLKKLKERFVLGVVSDTWPSLERVFINRGLRKYFSTFIMSSIHGSYKAEKTLFKIALEELNLKPNEVIFIDDSESNLDAAKELGMIPILIDRYETENLKSNYPVIKSLEELIN